MTKQVQNSYHIVQQRIMKFALPQGFDRKTIQIGVPVVTDEANKVGLNQLGDAVLPSADFGPQCRYNAHGYKYADKTKDKVERYISTNWVYPHGNTKAQQMAVDIYRKCYPKVEVQPLEIELQLTQNDGKTYVIAVLTDKIRKAYLKEVVNLFLEIYGNCYIFKDTLDIDRTPIRRCNWRILPPGELPSKQLKLELKESGANNTNTYDSYRLECIEKYEYESIVEGINGFKGYYAFVFNEYCVFECAIYGNATYIVPKDNWESLSQMTKQELINSNRVVARLEHTSNWKKYMEEKFKRLGIKRK